MKPATRHRRPPTKTELARFKALSDMGVSPHAIGKHTERDPKTVRKWLQSEVYQTDEGLQELIVLVKQRELDDLYLLGAKARQRLHELLDSGKTKVIETTAVMDRTFQQRRLLEGSSTANHSLMALIIQSDRTFYRDKRVPQAGKAAKRPPPS